MTTSVPKNGKGSYTRWRRLVAGLDWCADSRSLAGAGLSLIEVRWTTALRGAVSGDRRRVRIRRWWREASTWSTARRRARTVTCRGSSGTRLDQRRASAADGPPSLPAALRRYLFGEPDAGSGDRNRTAVGCRTGARAALRRARGRTRGVPADGIPVERRGSDGGRVVPARSAARRRTRCPSTGSRGSARRCPDPRSPVGAWTEETFLRRFRAGEVFPGSPMPWGAFARFTDDDLRAIYRYLRSLPATPNQTGAAVQAK